MSLRQEKLSVAAAAAAAGALNWWLLGIFWIYWAAYNPIASALLKPGQVVPYYKWVLYPTDVLTSVLVSIPLGLLVAWLGKRHFVVAVVAATLPYLAFVYWLGFALVIPSARLQLVVTTALSLLVVPLAAMVGRLVLRRFAPNNSVKPKPLRDSAELRR